MPKLTRLDVSGTEYLTWLGYQLPSTLRWLGSDGAELTPLKDSGVHALPPLTSLTLYDLRAFEIGAVAVFKQVQQLFLCDFHVDLWLFDNVCQRLGEPGVLPSLTLMRVEHHPKPWHVHKEGHNALYRARCEALVLRRSALRMEFVVCEHGIRGQLVVHALYP